MERDNIEAHQKNVKELHSDDRSGLVWFFKKYQRYFDIFYMVDIPVGSYQFINEDPTVRIILKYHIQIKLALMYVMAQ